MSFESPLDLSSRTPKSSNQISDWLVLADESTLREYLRLSETTPVLLLISEAGNQESIQLRRLVLSALETAQGKFAGIEVDIATSPALAQAVGVSQAPALIAILAGQPAPLFQGLVTPEQLAAVLGQVLQLAGQNSITGTVSIANKQQTEKPLSAEHQLAFDAIDRGDFLAARNQYEKILGNSPADQDAKAGLAQVEFLIRLQSEPGTSEIDKVLFTSDQQFASGDPKAAFETLLEAFATRFEDRDLIRTRLLGLFLILGDSEPVVLEARRKLASLMF